jgi:hypothetical protein
MLNINIISIIAAATAALAYHLPVRRTPNHGFCRISHGPVVATESQ